MLVLFSASMHTMYFRAANKKQNKNVYVLQSVSEYVEILQFHSIIVNFVPIHSFGIFNKKKGAKQFNWQTFLPSNQSIICMISHNVGDSANREQEKEEMYLLRRWTLQQLFGIIAIYCYGLCTACCILCILHAFFSFHAPFFLSFWYLVCTYGLVSLV